MPKAKASPASNFGQGLKKLVVSTFVVFTFISYAIHDRLSGSGGTIAVVPTVTSPSLGAPAARALDNNNNSAPVDPQQPTVVQPQSSDTSSQSANRQSGYRDGQYTGNVADAYYGNVQVRTTVQGGKITDVQFLTYPSDRRTSQRINNYAVPMLQSEAVQAQSAQVDLISGATLTSQAFAESLQSALDPAHG
jgi:uncharacterized protein with FMN-binding domain